MDVADCVRVAATFTVEPIAEALRFWMDRLSIPCTLEFAAYHQVFQQLLDPGSDLRTNRTGINVVWLRWDDLVSETGADHLWLSAVEAIADEFAVALEAATAGTSVDWLVVLGPTRRQVTGADRIDHALAVRLAQVPMIHVVDSRAVEATYPVQQWADAESDRFGHVPYTRHGFAAVATAVARHIVALRASARKVIVLDCDNTLWGGVCGEDGADGVRLDEPFLELQRFMLGQKHAGRVLCLASKNSEADALAVFDNRSDMVLSRDDLVSWRINWTAKADNIIAMAAELSLGLDSFVFVDDNPVECAEVRARLPQVLTLQLPERPADIPRFLDHAWTFDSLRVTDADRGRTQSYQLAVKREHLRGQSSSLADFIAGLGMTIDTAPATAADIPRVSQLTQRTNQFNSTTLRLDEAQVRDWVAAPGRSALAVRVADRFGDYGLVGVALAEAVAPALRVRGLLLSCRALGRGVEHQMLAQLGALAQRFSLATVELEFCPSERNTPVLHFLESLEAKTATGETTVYSVPSAVAAAAKFIPRSDAHDVADVDAATANRSSWPEPDVIARIAAEMTSVATVLAAIDGNARNRPDISQAYVPARGDRERALVQIWREVLHLDQVGTRDRFSDLGGSSIQLVRVHGLLLERLGVDVDITTLFQHPSIAELSAALDNDGGTRLSSVPERAANMRKALRGFQRMKERIRG